MTKVYIVVDGEYSDYHICQVFKTEELANKYIQECGGDIEEYELDTPPESWHYYLVRMRKDGELDPKYGLTHEIRSDWQKDGFICYDNLNNLVWQVTTNNKEKAIKVVSEKRTEILAHGLWDKTEETREYFGVKE